MKYLVIVLLKFFSWFWQWKKFEHWSIFDEVIRRTKRANFWGHHVEPRSWNRLHAVDSRTQTLMCALLRVQLRSTGTEKTENIKSMRDHRGLHRRTWWMSQTDRTTTALATSMRGSALLPVHWNDSTAAHRSTTTIEFVSRPNYCRVARRCQAKKCFSFALCRFITSCTIYNILNHNTVLLKFYSPFIIQKNNKQRVG